MAKVLIAFRDRETWVRYDVGDEYDGTPERVACLADAGLIKVSKPATKRTGKTATEE